MGSFNSKHRIKQHEIRRKKLRNNFFGIVEVETQLVSEGTEADLHQDFFDCMKNPGHKHFIPVNDFTIKHLPEGYQDVDLFHFIQSVADLTVRVSVTFTSPNRLFFWPGTKVAYPSYDSNRKQTMRTGTGKIYFAQKYTPEDNYGTCPCSRCQLSDTPSKVWGILSMYTATHVIFDDLEANHTSCRLFFERQGVELVCLHGWTMHAPLITEDICILCYVTCDITLLDKVIKLVKTWDDLWEPVFEKFKNVKDVAKLSFIVSHPHGCPKQVSVGRWVDRVEVGHSGETRYTYSTCTCPGSSGALVHILGSDDGFWHTHVHTGVNAKKINYSGVGWSRQFHEESFKKMDC